MKYKEIDECAKELNGCNECVLAEGDDECVLNILQDLIDKLEEKQQ